MFTHPTYLQLFLAISLPIMGLAYALVGGLKLALVDRLQIDEGKVGRLVGGFGTMFGPTILLCGFLTDSLGRKGVWVAGSAAVAAAVLIFALTRTFRGALVAVLLLGVGWAAQVNVGNVLMRVAVPADRPASELVWAANFFDFVFGFGALVTPFILGLLLRKLQYTRGLVVLALVAALPMVLGLFAQMNPAAAPPPPDAPPVKESGMGALVSNPLIWVLGFAFLFFVPLETSVAGWATTLIQRQTPPGVPPDQANRFASLTLSAFWFGRLAAGPERLRG